MSGDGGNSFVEAFSVPGGSNASGLAVDTADDKSLKGYFNDKALPDKSLSATSADGRVGIANVPPGPAKVSAKVDGKDLPTRNIFIREGALSYVAMDPVPTL